MSIVPGQLRWTQDYTEPGDPPPYHLSFNGSFTVCSKALSSFSSSIYQEPLTGTPSEPRCPDCLANIRLQLGFATRPEEG